MKLNKKIILNTEFKRYFIYVSDFDKNSLIEVALKKDVLMNYTINEFLPLQQIKNLINTKIKLFNN